MIPVSQLYLPLTRIWQLLCQWVDYYLKVHWPQEVQLPVWGTQLPAFVNYSCCECSSFIPQWWWGLTHFSLHIRDSIANTCHFIECSPYSPMSFFLYNSLFLCLPLSLQLVWSRLLLWWPAQIEIEIPSICFHILKSLENLYFYVYISIISILFSVQCYHLISYLWSRIKHGSKYICSVCTNSDIK